MKVFCRTNLDLSNEEWPNDLPAIPSVGDRIQSKTKHGHFQLELQVSSITWRSFNNYNGESYWAPEIELHMTTFHKGLYPKDNKDGNIGVGSITAFYQWYAPLVGKSVGSFI